MFGHNADCNHVRVFISLLLFLAHAAIYLYGDYMHNKVCYELALQLRTRTHARTRTHTHIHTHHEVYNADISTLHINLI